MWGYGGIVVCFGGVHRVYLRQCEYGVGQLGCIPWGRGILGDASLVGCTRSNNVAVEPRLAICPRNQLRACCTYDG